jgi:signal transduction histidine kinase/ActR/RegA family two-component response regulator
MAILLGVLALYFAAGKLGLALASVHASVSPFWPATGVALAAALLFGPRVWPAILLGAFLVNATTSGTVATSLGIAFGNMLEPLAGAWLVERFARGRRAFEGPLGVFLFVLLAGLASTTLSATIGVASLGLGGLAPWSRYGEIWLTWWLGDVTGALIATPLLVLWAVEPLPRWTRAQALEALALFATLFGVSALAFGAFASDDGDRPALRVVCMAPVLWAAFRFGPREAATAGALLSFVAVLATTRLVAQGSILRPNEVLLELQVFASVTVVTALAFAAAIRGRLSAEERVRKLNEELERETLLREQAARRDAEESSRLKDEFLAVLSHELRTPLNAIQGWAQILHDGGADDATQRKAIETILRNARVQTQLISDILDVSRIVAGKLAIDRQPLDLAPLLAAVIDTVQPAARARHVAIESVGDAVPSWVLGDAARLQQVFANVLGNAIKFAPAATGRVEVLLRCSGETVEVEIRDNGPGIHPEFLPYVFERFRQADSSTTRARGGLGLGLAVARHLVELHGGSIRAANRSDAQGAVITVALPLVTAQPAAPRRPPSAEFALAASLEGLSILAVDDEQDARELLRRVLERWNARVRVASSVEDAILELARGDIDLVVTDIAMPKRDGYELLRTLRASAPEISVIAVTAYASGEDAQRLREAGFAAHVAKPIEPETLKRAILALAQRNALSAGVRKGLGLPRAER